MTQANNNHFVILVIDDDSEMQAMMKRMLERAGYAVTLASNGQMGLELLNQNHFDLIITDIFMPEKEGLETIATIKTHRPDAKIIAISGGGFSDSGETYLKIAKNIGAQHVFSKPFERKRMLKTIDDLLK